ncbi:MAG: YceI family protein [Microthrixaceae bacterium]|nr:YceI family protein [Microthrixaceae bacterium]
MRFELDPERSAVTVHASSSVHPITTDAPAAGWLELTLAPDGRVDTGAPVDGEIEVALGSMRSGNPLVDREAERRLHLRRFPTVTGRLTALAPAGGDGPGEEHDGEGVLEFHGTSRPLRGTLRVTPGDGGALAVAGATELDVTDFGVQPPSLLVVKVHARVRVELAAVAVPAGPRP